MPRDGPVGHDHITLLDASGTLWAYGNNTWGLFGDGKTSVNGGEGVVGPAPVNLPDSKTSKEGFFG